MKKVAIGIALVFGVLTALAMCSDMKRMSQAGATFLGQPKQ